MKAEFPNANLQLWPGQFVNVRVLIDTLKQVVVVPTPAVQRGPNGTFAYVVQADDTRGSAADHGGAADRDHGRHRQGHRRRRSRRHHGLCPSQGRRARRRRATPEEPASRRRGRQGRRRSAKSEAREKMRAACAADVQKLCPDVERGKEHARLPAGERGAAVGALQGGDRRGSAAARPREADARKADGSSTQ